MKMIYIWAARKKKKREKKKKGKRRYSTAGKLVFDVFIIMG